MKVLRKVWKQIVIIVLTLIVGIISGYTIGHNEIRVEDHPQYIAITNDNFSDFTLPVILPDSDFADDNKIGDLK
jgi:hypothetical protein